MASSMFFPELSEPYRITREMTSKDVKDLEFLLSLIHPPWSKSADGDALSVVEKMRQRMIWFFDIESKQCNLSNLIRYMECIERRDLGHKLHVLGTLRSISVFIEQARSQPEFFCGGEQ